MRALLQRVSSASVAVGDETVSSQQDGFLILLGIETNDLPADIDWLVRKITQMRVFDDNNGKMNLSIRETGGDITVVSQFTLHASTKKGNRPSFIRAARPEISEPLYEQFCDQLATALGKPVGAAASEP